MIASIVSFRRSVNHTYGNQMILFIENSNNREKAEKFVGKKLEYKTESGKIIKGEVTAPHGNSGNVLAKFETGMPGQSLGKTVNIL